MAASLGLDVSQACAGIRRHANSSASVSLLAASRLRAAPATSARWSSSVPFPKMPHSKSKLEVKRELPLRKWETFNAPNLAPKFLRHAERTARELGVLDELAAFDEAAAAFPNPTLVYAATLLERSALILRDVEAWEADWLAYKVQRQAGEAKEYPKALIDQFTASSTVLEKSDGGEGEGAKEGGKKDKKAKAAAAAAAGGEGGEGDAAAAEAAAAAAPPPSTGGSSGSGGSGGGGNLEMFYERSGSSAGEESKKAGLVVAQRVTPADGIGDTRSLDRAYSQRLVLLVKERGEGGAWTVPGASRKEGEPMRQAAERSLRSLFGSSELTLDYWYVGAAPVGHALTVFPPALQAASGAYGAKTFFYRAELLNGKFSLPKGEPGDDRDASSFPYDDFHWLTRDETERYLPRPVYKYLHQVIGAGPGEEHARRTAWLQRIQAKGLSPAQASGRRAYRVEQARRPRSTLGAPRLRAVATADQAAVAAAPFTDGDKRERLAGAVDAYHARLRAQSAISDQLRVTLATPPASVVAAQRDAAKRAAAAAAEAAASAAAAAASHGAKKAMAKAPATA